MAASIRIKRSTGGSAPSSLSEGELAYSEAAGTNTLGILYIGASGATVIPVGGRGHFATLASPTFTGVPAAPTASTSDNSTQIATTAFVKAQSYLTSVSATPGTYTKVTVAASGLVTSGTTLSASDIPTLTASKISDFDTQVRTSRIDQMAAPTGSLSLNNQTITNLADPSGAQDATNRRWVEALFNGTDNKGSVRVATTGNVTLAGSAPDTVDGKTLAANELILVWKQTDPKENGPYKVQTLGTGSNGTWVRADNADINAEVTSGLFVFVSEGTLYGGNGYTLTTPDPILLGTTNLTFTQTSGAGQITNGPGIGKNGNELYVKLGGAGSPAGYAYTTGGLVWCDSGSSLNMTAALSGVIMGNNTSAPTAATGTQYGIVYWATTTTIASTAASDSANKVLHGNPSGAGTWSAVSLTADVSGTLPVGNGGSGATTLTGILKGNGTSAFTAVTGAATRVTFWSDANTLSSASTFIWDGANLGVGAAPSYSLHVAKTAPGDNVTISSDNLATSGVSRLFARAQVGGSLQVCGIFKFGSTYSGDNGLGQSAADSAALYNDSGFMAIGNSSNATLYIATNQLPRITILGGGAVGVGMTPTNLLDVAGSQLITGGLLVGGSGAVSAGRGIVVSRTFTTTVGNANIGIECMPTAAVTTVLNFYGGRFRLITPADAGCAVTDARTIGIDDPTLGTDSVITNLYQIHIATPTKGTTLNYSIYSAGGLNYFAGLFGFGAATVPTSMIHGVKASIGVTQSDAYGLLLSNTTAAAAGAQQYSPPIVQMGKGWKTDSTAASQSVAFRNYVIPVQGAAAPTGKWIMEAAIDGGSYGIVFAFDSGGVMTDGIIDCGTY